MADIELTVKIDADVYTRIFDNGIQDYEIATDDICEMARSLRRGTPLPKGHGRLKDVDKLKTHYVGTELGTDLEVYLESTIENAPTIIEADKAESEE